MVMKRELGFKGERFIYLPLSILEQMEKNPLTGDLYIYSLGYFIGCPVRCSEKQMLKSPIKLQN